MTTDDILPIVVFVYCALYQFDIFYVFSVVIRFVTVSFELKQVMK